MFHLHFKDYIFLLAVMVILMFVAGAFFLFSSKSTNSTFGNNATTYACGDIIFSVEIPLTSIKEKEYGSQEISEVMQTLRQSGLQDLFNDSSIDKIKTWRADDSDSGYEISCYHTSGSYGSEAVFSANINRTIQNLSRFNVIGSQPSINTLEYFNKASSNQGEYIVAGRFILFPNEIVGLSALTSNLAQQSALDAFLRSFRL